MALLQKLYTYKTTQVLPISLDEAWKFFKNPMMLKEITPSYMDFKVTNTNPRKEMYQGMLITYIVKPVLGIPLRWCTEITEIQDRKMFIDEQRFGPYKMWHHEHWFTEVEGGVKMDDEVTYGIPFGPIGQLANTLFVQNQIKAIFEYRYTALEDRFGKIS